VFDALKVDLCQSDFDRKGSIIARRSHRASLPPDLRAAAEKIRSALAEKPFDPPGRQELAKDRHQQQALRFLVDQGEIVELNGDILLLRDTAIQMQTAVSDLISRHGPATASQLRQKIGTSRRVIIPFLESRDRMGVPRRVGDERVFAQKAAAATVTD